MKNYIFLILLIFGAGLHAEGEYNDYEPADRPDARDADAKEQAENLKKDAEEAEAKARLDLADDPDDADAQKQLAVAQVNIKTAEIVLTYLDTENPAPGKHYTEQQLEDAQEAYAKRTEEINKLTQQINNEYNPVIHHGGEDKTWGQIIGDVFKKVFGGLKDAFAGIFVTKEETFDDALKKRRDMIEDGQNKTLEFNELEDRMVSALNKDMTGGYGSGGFIQEYVDQISDAIDVRLNAISAISDPGEQKKALVELRLELQEDLKKNMIPDKYMGPLKEQLYKQFFGEDKTGQFANNEFVNKVFDKYFTVKGNYEGWNLYNRMIQEKLGEIHQGLQ